MVQSITNMLLLGQDERKLPQQDKIGRDKHMPHIHHLQVIKILPR